MESSLAVIENHAPFAGELKTATDFLKKFAIEGGFQIFKLQTERRLARVQMFGRRRDTAEFGSDVEIKKMIVVEHASVRIQSSRVIRGNSFNENFQ